jgi:hypothetical protein
LPGEYPQPTASLRRITNASCDFFVTQGRGMIYARS